MTSDGSSTSRFTPVNIVKDQNISTDSIASAPNETCHSHGEYRKPSDERSSGETRLSPRDLENLTIIATSLNQKDIWASAPTNGERNTYQIPHSHHVNVDTLKRRRSSPVINNSDHNIAVSTSSSKHISATSPAGSSYAHEDSILHQLKADSRESYSSENQYKQYLTTTENRDPASESEPWNLRTYSQQTNLTSDEQIGQALQQASQNLDSPSRHQDIPSLSEKSCRNSDSLTRNEPKKRKRNFSNRTKTGCMTCRRRKKKCDEAKPHCNNCLRGGFVCSGYQQCDSWSKNHQKSTRVRLQSKTEYENSPYGLTNPYLSTSINRSQEIGEPQPSYREQILRIDQRPDNRICEGSHEPSAPDFAGAVQMPTPLTITNSSYSNRHPKNPFDCVASISHFNRQEPRIGDSLGITMSLSQPSISRNLHAREETVYSNAQVAAQMALSNLASTSRSCILPEEAAGEDLAGRPTQKEEMLAGRLYFPFDKQLIKERDICRRACWRFNHSVNPDVLTSHDERVRFFYDILSPRPIGDNFVIEPPFTCDYGYNISIGNDVIIGKNCTIIDACEVRIGDRCHLGPNVNIYTVSLPIDPKKRMGAGGPQLAKKVIIESDCWIGGGVIVLPGRTIGKGATIGAGSVVTKDVPPYTIARGNPAHILRAVSNSEKIF